MNAENLLQRMRQTKHGWKPKDFAALYKGFGFDKEEGGNHTTYIYEKYGLIEQIPRHNDLAPVYATRAIKLIERLKELQRIEAE